VPLCNPREGGCAGGGGQTAWGGGVRKTLKPWTPHPGGTPNGSGQASHRRWSRTHVHMLQHIFQHPSTHPKVETLATANVETEPKIQKHRSGQIIRDDFHELGCRRDVQDMDITNDNVFPDEMEADLDMLRTLMLNGVGEEIDDADVVAVDESAL
jgi:hypothetical protein